MSADRLRELFNQHADDNTYGYGTELCMTWEAFEVAARALLAEAQPQPVEPTDEEWDLEKQHIWCIYKCTTHEGTEVVEEVDFMRALDDARAVLARWGHPAPEPVSVAERPWEREGWCDEDGRCWLFGKVEGDWRLMSAANSGLPSLKYCFSHALPHWALPVPLPTTEQ